MPKSMKLSGGEHSAIVDLEDEELTEPSEGDVCQSCGSALDAKHSFCPVCGEKRRRAPSALCRAPVVGCCFGCCTCLAVTALIVGFCVAIYLNAWIKFAVESVGSAETGVDVSVGAVNVGLVQGRVSLTELEMDSPDGFEGAFLQLGRFIFDVSPLSLFAGWLSGFVKPIELEEVTLLDTAVAIEMTGMVSGDSNANEIVAHMNKVTKDVQAMVPQLKPVTPDQKDVVNQGLKVMEAKVKADHVELRNITASVAIPPLAPLSFTLKSMVIQDVGKRGDGVYLYEFIDILIRALLMAVLKSAPSNIRSNLARAFGTDLWRTMDYAWVKFDNGEGLEELGEFAGWATTEAALLPAKMAAQGAAITADALGVGVKLNTEALKAGAALTGMATKGQLAATNAQVEIGAKAAAAAAKMGLSFSNGMAQALAR